MVVIFDLLIDVCIYYLCKSSKRRMIESALNFLKVGKFLKENKSDQSLFTDFVFYVFKN